MYKSSVVEDTWEREVTMQLVDGTLSSGFSKLYEGGLRMSKIVQVRFKTKGMWLDSRQYSAHKFLFQGIGLQRVRKSY